MKAKQIYQTESGAVTLLYCDFDRMEEMVSRVRAEIPAALRERAALNAGPVVSMELYGDDQPNSFRGLAALAGRLIVAAGRRSRFEGLLLLNIENLLVRRQDLDRLLALGEFLFLKDGLASRCSTVLYGPTEEFQVLMAADHLDFDGRLRVARYESLGERASLKALLETAHISCASRGAARLLQAKLDELQGEEGFDPLRFVRACARGGDAITEADARAVLDDPFSYANRLTRARAILEAQPARRRIGFMSGD